MQFIHHGDSRGGHGQALAALSAERLTIRRRQRSNPFNLQDQFSLSALEYQVRQTCSQQRYGDILCDRHAPSGGTVGGRGWVTRDVAAQPMAECLQGLLGRLGKTQAQDKPGRSPIRLCLALTAKMCLTVNEPGDVGELRL